MEIDDSLMGHHDDEGGQLTESTSMAPGPCSGLSQDQLVLLRKSHFLNTCTSDPAASDMGFSVAEKLIQSLETGQKE